MGIAFNASAGNSNADKALYERDGHYWTVRLMAYLVLKDTSMARQLAYFAEWPDATSDADGNHLKSRNTWLLPWRQASWHALTGGSCKKCRATSMRRFKKASTTKQKGIMLHRLGDSFAHAMKKDKRMFPYGIGHALRMHTPDKIANFPKKYLTYVDSLCITLGGNPKDVDMAAFKYIADKKFDTYPNMQILKTELYIQSGVDEYTVPSAYAQIVANYLDFRNGPKGFTYTLTNISVPVEKIGRNKYSHGDMVAVKIKRKN